MVSSSGYKVVALLAVALALTLVGCSESDSQIQAEVDEWKLLSETPYSVWVTAKKFSGYELSRYLKQDEDFANQVCRTDSNRPALYVQHMALVSTPGFNRVDALQKFNLDPESIVRWSNTDRVFTKHLGKFLEQTGTVNPENKAGIELIKLTFSEQGQFSGYCESAGGYMPTIYTQFEGEMQRYATRCDLEGVIVCMSVR